MKVALYARVSTNKQRNENQIPRLEEEGRRRGWESILYVEQESTRKTRPVKENIKRMLRDHELDGVCFVKLDRWARSVSEGALEINELVQRGKSVFSLSDGLEFIPDSRTNELPSMQKFQLHVILAFAELERDLIRERTLEGLERARREGKTLGRPKGAKDKGYRKRRRIRA